MIGTERWFCSLPRRLQISGVSFPLVIVRLITPPHGGIGGGGRFHLFLNERGTMREVF